MAAFEVSTDPARIDVGLVHRFLSEESSWARGLPPAQVEKAQSNNRGFGGYLDGNQVAFARVITDRATFANMVDVFVLPGHRGNGYSKQLVESVLAHPDLQGLRRFTLATGDAHGLYARFGFTPPLRPATLMERYYPDVYQRCQ